MLHLLLVGEAGSISITQDTNLWVGLSVRPLIHGTPHDRQILPRARNRAVSLAIFWIPSFCVMPDVNIRIVLYNFYFVILFFLDYEKHVLHV